jgi:hypothetical protein
MCHNVIDSLVDVSDPEDKNFELTLFLLSHAAAECELHELA